MIYTGDSKAFSKETLEHCEAEDVDLITRVPHTYNAPDELIDQAWEDDDWTNVGTVVQDDDDDEAAEYHLQSYLTKIHERTLRGIVVNSSELDGRTERRIERELSRTEDALEEAIDELEDRYFECEPDAESAADESLDEHDEDLFTIDCIVTETERKKSRDKPGRPPKDWEPSETVYRVEASQAGDEEAIATYKAKESCFVVVTTLDVDDHLTDEAVLWEYKEQQTVERRFPVLKDPKLVGPVYVDDQDRVECLGNVLPMALLVYSIIERRVRLTLEGADEPMDLVGGKTSFRPTGRRVLERFGNVMTVHTDGGRQFQENDAVPNQVLELLGLDRSIFGV